MNNLWKRAASLMLSSVLLMSSVPVQVWATEEDPAVLTQTLPQGGDGVPAGGNPVIDLPIAINGEQITSTDAEDILGDGTVSFVSDSDGYKLVLKKATDIHKIEVLGVPLTIVLEGNNEITAHSSTAISTNQDLSITGDGSLTITSSNAAAVKVASSEADEKVLTIDGVQICVQIAEEQPVLEDEVYAERSVPVGIDCAGGVVVQGAAHFATTHSALGMVYTLAEGYIRTSTNDPFTAAETSWVADGKGFEFIATEHLEAKYLNDTQHELTCKKGNGKICMMNQSQVDLLDHVEEVAAGCGEAAWCRDCEENYGEVVAAHRGPVSLVPVEDAEQHVEFCSACDNEISDRAGHDYKVTCSKESATRALLTVKCVCGAEKENEKVVLEAPLNLNWDNSDKKAIVTPAETPVTYFTIDGENRRELEENTYPKTPGMYAAVVETEIEEETYTLEVEYTILAIPLNDSMVVLSSESAEYDGNPKTLPEVTVADLIEGTDYDLTFTRAGAEVNEEGRTNAGEITVSVIGKGNYSGTVTKTFTIKPAVAAASQFEYTKPTVLTYNGQAKVATIAAKRSVIGMGETEVRYYKNGTRMESCVDAGIYEAKVYVKGTGNYAEGEIANKEEWSFEILPADVSADGVCVVSVETEQTVGNGLSEFTGPTFTGYTKAGAEMADKLTGTITYIYGADNKTTTDVATLKNYLNGLEDGATVKIGYTFTPAQNVTNYTGTTLKKEITVTKSTMIVKNDGVAGTKTEIGNAIKADNPKYGDKIVDISKLSVHIGEASDDTDGNFVVKYAKFNGSAYGEPTAMEKPDAGQYKFYVYYNNANLGGMNIVDAVVAVGDVNIERKTPSITQNKPVAEYLVAKEDGSAQPLLKQGKEGKTDDGDALEYSLTENGTYSATVPTATAAGCYEVWYRSPSNANYTTPAAKGKVQVLVIPYLTATYGQTFNDVKNQLPTGFSFNAAAHPDLMKTVGNAGNQKVKLDYTHPDDRADVADDYPILTAHEVTLKVNPKTVTLVVALNADVYDQNDDGYVPFGDATKDDLFIVTADGKTFVNGTDYKLQKTASTDGLTCKHIISVKDGSNYTFETAEGTVKLYKAAHGVLSEDNYPKDTLENYETVDKAKEALSEKLKADTYPKDLMKFFKVYVTKQVGDKLADNQWAEYTADDAFPPAGLAYEIPYSALSNATEKDNFKVAVLYLAGEDAGKIVLQETALTDTGVKINLEREAVVCVAKEVDLTKEYTITKSIVLDSKTSTQGSLTIKVDNETATKATYGKTVKVTASAKSGYSIVSVTVTDASGNKVETKQDGSNYEFSMPASNVTVKLSLKKTTSSTKNPGSGDSSNIQLWTTILAASGIGVVAALFFWLRKRKK